MNFLERTGIVLTTMEELEQQFTQGQQLYLKLEDSSLPSTNKAFQDDVAQALQLLNEVATGVLRQQLFSPNEELDDIRTDILK